MKKTLERLVVTASLLVGVPMLLGFDSSFHTPAAVISVNGETGEVVTSAGGDNFGSHVSTKGVAIGTPTAQAYGATISTATHAPGPIFNVLAGTQTLFEITGTSASYRDFQLLDGTASTQTKVGGLTLGGWLGLGGATPVGGSLIMGTGSGGTNVARTITIAQHPTSGVGEDLIIQAGPANNNGGSNTNGGALQLKSGNVSGQGKSRMEFFIGTGPGAFDGVDRNVREVGQWDDLGLVIGSVGDGPNVMLDVRGVIHSSNSAHFALGGGSVTVGGYVGGINNPPPTPSSKFVVIGGSTTITGSNAGLIIRDIDVNSQGANLLHVSSSSNMPGIGVEVSSNSYLNIVSSAPQHTLSTCGTGPTIRGGGNMMSITPGSGGPGACTVTFGVPFKNTPVCIAQPLNGSVVNTFSFAYTNVSLTATETGIGTFVVMCSGHE